MYIDEYYFMNYAVMDEVHRPCTWVKVEIPSVKYYSSKSGSAPFKRRLE